ncbi:MAG: hypothetical protein M3O34_16600 [Chloroflexota bacterium]|nr:hypothetical protein [Chloroflexota bacterium]
MVLARRHAGFAAALVNYGEAERVARAALFALVNKVAELPPAPESLDAATLFVDALAEAQGKLSPTVADLYDAIDDFLDHGPSAR